MNIVAMRKGAIGDSLLSFPVLAALRARYADPHITFVGHPAVMPLAKAWGIAEEAFNYEDRLWDEVFSSDGIHSSNVRDLFQQTDLAICWVQDPASLVKPNLLKAGVKEVVIGPWCASEKDTKHMVKSLAEPLGLEPLLTEFVIPSTAWSNGFCPYNPPIAIHPGSSAAGRRWSTASFVAVINQLLHLRCPVLLLAGPAEAEVLKEVRKQLSPSPQPGLLSVLQNAPLLEVALRLQQCQYYLGNDSGIGHLAGMLGIPTLILFGPASFISMPPHVMHPVGPRVETIQAQSLDRISPDRVIERMLRQLAENSYSH
ncbi:MAG TPA: glycosyltransferase family 9 protein [Ktedonobacteraceae bacterium]|nr:glycosyltransferase family 9 protein [Ktedonobacteraceae bacterium]